MFAVALELVQRCRLQKNGSAVGWNFQIKGW